MILSRQVQRKELEGRESEKGEKKEEKIRRMKGTGLQI